MSIQAKIIKAVTRRTIKRHGLNQEQLVRHLRKAFNNTPTITLLPRKVTLKQIREPQFEGDHRRAERDEHPPRRRLRVGAGEAERLDGTLLQFAERESCHGQALALLHSLALHGCQPAAGMQRLQRVHDGVVAHSLERRSRHAVPDHYLQMGFKRSVLCGLPPSPSSAPPSVVFLAAKKTSHFSPKCDVAARGFLALTRRVWETTLNDIFS